MKRPIVLWILAIVVTISSVVYQRLTGPTHPIRDSIMIGESNIKYKLLRTHESTADAIMEISVPDKAITGTMSWRRLRSNDTLSALNLEREGNNLIVSIPKQPAAGKVVYQVKFYDDAGTGCDLTDEPVIIRFKDPVPLFVIIPHVFFIFLAMLYSTRTGFEAIVKGEKTYRLIIRTSALLFIGGLILGPVVQKYAFDAYWTGWPFGHDLTDNKTAVAMLFWLIALWRGRIKDKGRGWIIAASIVTLVIFLIPHSVLGSELDYTKIK